jgi:hypothetical protein
MLCGGPATSGIARRAPGRSSGRTGNRTPRAVAEGRSGRLRRLRGPQDHQLGSHVPLSARDRPSLTLSNRTLMDNIRNKDFLAYLIKGSGREQDAKLTTLCRIANYLGWREFVRTEVQLLRFENEEDTRLPRPGLAPPAGAG